MYVYNTEDDRCREVLIKPNSQWGGEGSLGCGIGYGYLHRIPIRMMPTEKTPILNPQVSCDCLMQSCDAVLLKLGVNEAVAAKYFSIKNNNFIKLLFYHIVPYDGFPDNLSVSKLFCFFDNLLFVGVIS